MANRYINPSYVRPFIYPFPFPLYAIFSLIPSLSTSFAHLSLGLLHASCMPCLFSPLYGNHAHVTPINLQNRVKGVCMNKQTLIKVQKVNKEISIYRLIHSVTEVIIGLCASLLEWFSFSVFCLSFLHTYILCIHHSFTPWTEKKKNKRRDISSSNPPVHPPLSPPP